MTTAEKQELQYLTIVINNKWERVDRDTLDKVLKDEFGDDADIAFTQLQILEIIKYFPNTIGDFKILSSAAIRYKELKSKSFWEWPNKIFVGTGVAVAIISGILIIGDHLSCHEKKSKSTTKPAQQDTTQNKSNKSLALPPTLQPYPKKPASSNKKN